MSDGQAAKAYVTSDSWGNYRQIVDDSIVRPPFKPEKGTVFTLYDGQQIRYMGGRRIRHLVSVPPEPTTMPPPAGYPPKEAYQEGSGEIVIGDINAHNEEIYATLAEGQKAEIRQLKADYAREWTDLHRDGVPADPKYEKLHTNIESTIREAIE